MAEQQLDGAGSSTVFRQATADTIVLDTEYIIRQAFQEDPRRGYELLFRRYYRNLCSQAVRFVHSRTIAEDVVSDVFFSFWKNQVHQHLTGSYRAYLYVAVRKRAYGSFCQEIRQELTSDAEAKLTVATNELDPNQLVQYTELYQRIQQTVQTLPPQCQRVFILNRFEGKSYREISEELRIAPKTIEAHISRALSQLRQAVQAYMLLIALLAVSEPVVKANRPLEIRTVVTR